MPSEQRLALRGRRFHLRGAGHVGAVCGAPDRLGEPPTHVGDHEPGDDRDTKGETPPVVAEMGSERRADHETEPQADVGKALLDREGSSPPLEHVVIGQQARARRAGDGLAEAERPPQHHQEDEGAGRDRPTECADHRPHHDRERHDPRTVPAIAEVAGGHGRNAAHNDEGGEEDADLEIANLEDVLDLVGCAPDDVLIDVVDHADEAEDPHGPGRCEREGSALVQQHRLGGPLGRNQSAGHLLLRRPRHGCPPVPRSEPLSVPRPGPGWAAAA